MTEKMHFEDGGRYAAAEIVSPRTVAAIGAACGSVGGKLLAAHSGSRAAETLAYGFAAGAASMGADCYLTGECSDAAASYAAGLLGCKIGCMCHTEISSSFRIFGGDGLKLRENEENEIDSHFLHTANIPYSHYGRIIRFDGASELYVSHMKKVPKGRLNVFADFYSSSQSVVRECEGIVSEVNNRNGERIAFHISGDGSRISAYTEKTGYVFREKLELLCFRELFKRGEAAGVCGKPMKALETLAEKYGGRIVSCGKNLCGCKADKNCDEVRKLVSEQRFMNDAIALSVMVLEILRKDGVTLDEAVSELPKFSGISRYIPADKPSELLERLSLSDGVMADGSSGRVTVRPVRTGKGIMLNVESYALEAASELSDFYEDIINRVRSRM